MKNQIILILLIFLSLNSYSQSKKDCKHIIKKKIEIKNFEKNTDGFLDEFNNNFHTMLLCYFDDIDYEIFMGPNGEMPAIFLSELIFSLNENEKNEGITYSMLRDVLFEFKKSELYSDIRKKYEAKNLILTKDASVENWNTDKMLLAQMGFYEIQLDEIFNIVKQNENKKYDEILIIYSDLLREQEKEKESLNVDFANFTDSLIVFQDYEVGLQNAKDLNKLALVYFNGYGCINSREMENIILLNKTIHQYIEDNFVVINLYTDDRTKLDNTEMYYSEILNKDVTTIGDRNLEIEIKYYEINYQPIFVLLSSNGEKIEMMGFTLDAKKFQNFLYKR